MFAPSLNQLSKSGIGVAVAPTGGMGLALNDKGKVPAEALTEAWREVGAVDQPVLAGTWVNYDSAGQETAAFAKDALGWVHLKGLVKDGAAAPSTIFTLPEGYRPRRDVRSAVTSNALFAYVSVSSAGVVKLEAGSILSVDLTPIYFRAA